MVTDLVAAGLGVACMARVEAKRAAQAKAVTDAAAAATFATRQQLGAGAAQFAAAHMREPGREPGQPLKETPNAGSGPTPDAIRTVQVPWRSAA
ncbi:MAG: hypothetical protein AB7I32_07875 [Gammaproteobacteria bacterium]